MTMVSAWTMYTLAQPRIHAALAKAGIGLLTGRKLVRVAAGRASLACIYTGEQLEQAFRSLVLVTSRAPDDRLYRALSGRRSDLADAGIAALHRVGDCDAPGTIAAAVYSG